MRRFLEYSVYTSAEDFAVAVYDTTRSWPGSETYGLTSQVRRAAVSVPSNIAEGSSRRSEVDFTRFLRLALGSLAELECQLRIASRLGYSVDPVVGEGLIATRRQLGALIRSMSK